MSTQLEGVELFDHVSDLIGAIRLHHPVSDWSTGWLLVPAMLEWLRGRCDNIEMGSHPLGFVAACNLGGTGYHPDLPTALARLVLRVSELENGGAK